MSSPGMRLSVIITTHNRAALVVEALQSVLRQSRLPDEIILVDDGSSDDTEAVLQPYVGAARYLRNPLLSRRLRRPQLRHRGSDR